MENTKENLHKNRWLILWVVVLLPFMSTLDASIVNVALPTMANKLSVTMAGIEWVVTSYLIVISAIILIFGRLGDIKGKTTVFKWGIALFTVGSLLCGLSNTLITLVISRIIQAVGAAATMSTSQGIVTQTFPATERGRALGINGTFVALGTMVGPPLGGFIISAFSWQYIFLINVPVGIIAFILGMKILPKPTDVKDENVDATGAVLFILAVVALFGAITRGQSIGYGNSLIILAFIGSMIAFAAFIQVELRTKQPLLQLEIFKNKLFSVSIFCAFISFVAINCTNIIQPFYLQDVLKLSPATTGLFMMIYPLVLSVVAPISGHLSDKIGSESLTFVGLICTAAGLLSMSTLNEHSSLITITLFIIMLALGNGLFQSPNTSLVMSTVPKHKLGIAGSVNALVRNLGLVSGISIATSLLYSRMSYKIGYRVEGYVSGREDVFIYGMRFVYITAAAICIVGAVLTAFRLRSKRKSVREIVET